MGIHSKYRVGLGFLHAVASRLAGEMDRLSGEGLRGGGFVTQAAWLLIINSALSRRLEM